MPLPDVFPSVLLLLVLVGLILAMRWVFKPSRPRRPPPVDATDARELGLLLVIATMSRVTATQLRDRFTREGIRVSLSRRRDGRVDVLVFHADADRARALL